MNTQRRNPWIGMAVISISLIIISLDNTVVNVALPSISRGLKASASELQWIVDAYILVFASLLLTMGSIGDRVGRKRALQFGVAWFGVFSLMAALSTSVGMLMAARALLGFGGAIIMPATLSLITASFLDHKQRAQAIAVWAAVFGLGLGLGPLVGGALLERFKWSSVFYINVPIAVVALLAGHFFLDDSKDDQARAPDVPGVVLSITGLFSLVYGIIQAGSDGWGATHVLVAFGAAIVFLSLFFWWERRAPNAMLPMFLFRNMSFTGANFAISLMMFGILGVMFFFTQFFQSVQTYTALQAGVRLFPMFLILMFASANSPRVAKRVGIKLVVGIGFLITAGGMFYLSQFSDAGASYGAIVPGLLLMGFGMGAAMSPATDSIMGSVPVHKAGVGSAMNDTTREVGGALGVAILGTLMNHRYLHGVTSLKGTLPTQVYEAVRGSIQGAHAVAGPIGGAAGDAIIRTSNHAFVTGMTEAMLIASVIMTGAALFSLIFLPAETRCIEVECLEEEARAVAGQVGMPAPASGD
jgi:EmrB/QacA subfamily drug resistance transporter